MKKKVLLIGGGGHCGVVIDLVSGLDEWEIEGIIDVEEKSGNSVSGFPVVGTDADLPGFYKKGIRHCFISAGSVGDSGLRERLYLNARAAGFSLPNFMHENALISARAGMGEGNYAGPGAVVNAGAAVGSNCILNTNSVIEHDCFVGDFAHIAPGAVLCGAVEVGARAHIGAGSVVIQGLKVGAGALIGAGSVVTVNISPGALARGNPCREVKR